MTKLEESFILPDWIEGDLLDALENYFAVRRAKRMMVNQRIVNGKVGQLLAFRSYGGLNLVDIVDRASEGDGKKPWLKFYLPRGFERVKGKPVQKREKKPESIEIKKIRAEIHRETTRIAKNKSWADPEDRALIKTLHSKLDQAVNDARRLGDLIKKQDNGVKHGH